MFGIEPLAIGGVLILAQADPSALCKMPAPTAINVKPTSEKLIYDYSGSLDDLQKTEIDTINPYGFGATSHTQAYASNLVQPEWSIELGHKFLPQYNAYCLWYEVIDLKINITPKITIAKEVHDNKCKYKHVKEHELKHIAVARQVVNKYSRTMGKKIYNGLSERGFKVGPIPAKNVKATVKRMQDTVGQLLDTEIQKMNIEHLERQQAVDSRAEYERVNTLTDACEHQGHSHSRNAVRRR